MATRYTTGELKAAVAKLSGWDAGDNVISRTFAFADHSAAMGFVVRVAMAAEVLDHHPDLRIVYNKVELNLNTHDAGGVTDLDIQLATKCNELAG